MPVNVSCAVCLAAVLAVTVGVSPVLSQGQLPPDHPSVTVRGATYTPRLILSRNMGSDEDQTTAFAPHKIIDNIYYVGTRTLTSFLIVHAAGKHPRQQHVRAKRAGHPALDRAARIQVR